MATEPRIPTVKDAPPETFLAIYCNRNGEILGIDPYRNELLDMTDSPEHLLGGRLRGVSQSIVLTPYVENPDCVWVRWGNVNVCVRG